MTWPAWLRTSYPSWRASSEQLGGRGGAAVGQEELAADGFLFLVDGVGRLGQHGQRAQEALVGLVLPRDRAVAAPAGPAELVQATVVAGAGVGVGGDHLTLAEGALGQGGPGRRRSPG